MRRYLFVLTFSFFFSFAGMSQSLPVITSQPQSQTVDAGQPVTFAFTATNADHYQWYVNGAKVSGATQTSYTFVATAEMTGETIWAVATNGASGPAVETNSVYAYVVPRTDVPLVTAVEDFGTAEAPQVADGFGLNVTSSVDWEFSACASIHCTWVRFDCPWNQQEIQQMPSNTSGGFAVFANCSKGLHSSSAYGLHPDVIAYWGPPYATIAIGKTSADTPVGSTSIVLGALSSGSLQDAVGGQTTLTSSLGRPTRVGLFEGGALVESISGNTLNLAMATNMDLPAGTTITVSLLLYPPVLIPPQPDNTSYVNNLSIQAFGNYLHFVASEIASTGSTGTVELWNEPENPSECWDWAPNCYNNPPPTFNIRPGVGMAIPLSAAAIPSVAGVRYANGWSDVTGFNSIYSFANFLPVSVTEANSAYAWDSIHPYGNNPEQTNWIPACLQQNSHPNGANIFFTCTPIGAQVGANFKIAASLDEYPGNEGGIPLAVTETGLCRTCLPTTPSETAVTRFSLRQFIAFQGNGVTPVIFFRAGGAASFNWFHDDQTPYPVALAFKSFMEDVDSIGNAPVSMYNDDSLPQVTSYSGYYPLAHVAIVGAESGAHSNSVMFLSWQKTYTVPPQGSDGNYGAAPPWYTLASPPGVPVSISIPNGMSVTSVKDLVEGATINYSVSSGVLSYLVADNPIEVMLSPNPNALAQTITFGGLSNVNFGAPPLTLSASSSSGLPVTLSVAGPATVTGSTLTITGVGTVTVTAMQSGNASYAAAAPVSQSFNVLKAQPFISWTPSPGTFTYGTALSTAELNASASIGGLAVPGTFAYTPAAGTVLPAGRQQLTVTFTPTDTADYALTSAVSTLVVEPALPSIQWANPAPIDYGTALSSTQLDAAASVPGTLVYSPAAGIVPPVGDNTLTATFTPADATDYLPATARVTLTVIVPPNPMPAMTSISPALTSAGSPAFTIHVTGSGFATSSSVMWGTLALATQFESSSEITAQVPASAIATSGTIAVTVQTQAPGGGASEPLLFEIDPPPTGNASGLIFSTASVTIPPGGVATYQIRLPAASNGNSVTCLNLPMDSTCAYVEKTNSVTIATSSATAGGTYQVTVVLSEVTPEKSAAGLILPVLLLLPLTLRRRLTRKGIWLPIVAFALLAGIASTIGCVANLSASTQTIKQSAVVSLTIQ